MSIISSRSSIWQLRDVQRGKLGAFYNLGTIPIEYILVAGGGAGGSAFFDGSYSGGGGAGGFLTNESGTPYEAFTGVTYAITIGAGGTAPANTGAVTGANTVWNTTGMTPGVIVTAFGGGGGGGHANAISFGTTIADPANPGYRSGGPGGSGGGGGTGWHWGIGGGTALGQIAPAAFGPQGYPGGSGGNYGYVGGGGGGGANQSGRDALQAGGGNWGHPYFEPGLSSYGGNGKTGFDGVARAGGGGGSTATVSATVGLGGTGNNPAGAGGTPGRTSVPGTPGVGLPGATNKGGGGGGSYGGPGNIGKAGGSGGSGVLVIRYPANYSAANFTTGSPAYQELNGYRIYTFNSSGTIQF